MNQEASCARQSKGTNGECGIGFRQDKERRFRMFRLCWSDLMGALRLIEAAPTEVVLLGVHPASADWGTVLTPEVFPAQQALMRFALEQLTQWKVEMSETAVGRLSTSHREQKQTDSDKAIWNTY
jgi:hypothetical protein